MQRLCESRKNGLHLLIRHWIWEVVIKIMDKLKKQLIETSRWIRIIYWDGTLREDRCESGEGRLSQFSASLAGDAFEVIP